MANAGVASKTGRTAWEAFGDWLEFLPAGFWRPEAVPAAPFYAYVLQLTGGRWYVGMTSRPRARFQQHYDGSGARWTARYRPSRVAEIVPCRTQDEALYVEKILTLRYARSKGFAAVRGGDFVWC